MTQITLSGLRFIVLSPSLLRLIGYPIEVIYAGAPFAWCITVDSKMCERTWKTRDAACAALARAVGTGEQSAMQ